MRVGGTELEPGSWLLLEAGTPLGGKTTAKAVLGEPAKGSADQTGRFYLGWWDPLDPV